MVKTLRKEDKILVGLFFDGMMTLQESYQLLIVEKIQEDGVGLAYLNQANTFFATARTFYFMNDFSSIQPLESFFFLFSRYNYAVLKYMSLKEVSPNNISMIYSELINESKWILDWANIEL